MNVKGLVLRKPSENGYVITLQRLSHNTVRIKTLSFGNVDFSLKFVYEASQIYSYFRGFKRFRQNSLEMSIHFFLLFSTSSQKQRKVNEFRDSECFRRFQRVLYVKNLSNYYFFLDSFNFFYIRQRKVNKLRYSKHVSTLPSFSSQSLDSFANRYESSFYDVSPLAFLYPERAASVHRPLQL